MKRLYFLLLLSYAGLACAQSYSGKVNNASTREPLEFVSIGVVGKDVGTVSDIDGSYSIHIGSEYDADSIRFSCIGYHPFTMKVSEYRVQASKTVSLRQQDVVLNDVLVNSSTFEDKTLGNNFKGRFIKCGFRDNNKGYELGVLLKIKKRALLQELICNIASTTYDSVFYRINVYKEIDKGSFENILRAPIYMSRKIEDTKLNTLTLDLTPYNIVVEGNTLVTVEHIVDMGEGYLFFSSKFIRGSKSYYRQTSQGNWLEVPHNIRLGIAVRAKVEQ